MVKNTLNVGRISEGFVLDHIQAGRSMDIYKYLHLDQLDCCVAIIKNAKSSKMGKKDIMKIECPIDFMDLDILGFIDHNITINIIKDEQIIEKKALHLPKKIKNVIRCKNPRCITSIEQELDHVFVLTDPEKIARTSDSIRRSRDRYGRSRICPCFHSPCVSHKFQAFQGLPVPRKCSIMTGKYSLLYSPRE